MNLSRRSIPAGKVTFVVRNAGQMTHEFEVVKWAGRPGGLPVQGNKARPDEDLEMGEVEDVDPGGSKRFTLNLRRGAYVGLCNVAGHYQLGQFKGFRIV